MAGASARHQYERRAWRERRRQERAVAEDAAWREQVVKAHPALGRIATLVTAKPVVGPASQRTRAWAKGAAGEEHLGRHLTMLPETVVVLHDRRIPGTKANIDHIAISPSGVFVIDAKNYAGRVEVRDVGSWLRSDERLYVNGRDRSRLLDGVHRQLHVVKGVLADDMPVRGVLCFVGENWPALFRRPLSIGDVMVLWPSKLVEQLSASGSLPAQQVSVIVERLSLALPMA